MIGGQRKPTYDALRQRESKPIEPGGHGFLLLLIIAAVIVMLILAATKCGAEELNSPGIVQPPRYPHAWFVFEASSIAAAIAQDARSYGASEYYSGGIERHHSVGKFLAINVPIGIGLGVGAWKLENSRRKPLRVIGHVAMWGAIALYSNDYFGR